MHFVHARSDRPDAPTLLVMHGWPHTFALQLDFADLLPDVNVVVPSFAGFAFSPPYPDGPATESRLASTMHALMTETLGYRSYFTYGEDVSANVNDLLAATHPESVDGILVTHAHFGTQEERAAIDDPTATAFFAQRPASTTRRPACSRGTPRSSSSGATCRGRARSVRKRSSSGSLGSASSPRR